MARYNPDAPMLDDSGIPNNPTLSNRLTPAQQQDAVRKLAAGQPLTVEEQMAVGITPETTSTGYNWTEGRAELDQLAAEAREAADAARKAVAEAKTAAEKAAADKLKAEADAKLRASIQNTSTTSNNVTAGLKTAAQIAAEEKAAAGKADRQSAYDLLYSQFKLYGLESLVEPLKGLITSGASPSEFTIKLRESDAYKKRFSANAQRVAKGLKSLSEAEYIQLEDQYQDVMRRYGLPDTYYARGEMGIQEGFNKFLEGDVSPVELEDRISTAQKRVLNANPEVAASLKEFYPDITNADILAYTLDPKNAIENIKRKVTAAEIGGAATQAGLKAGMTRAEELAAAGITKQQAQTGFQTVAEVAPRGSVLSEIYNQGPYGQTQAEQEVFGLAGSVEAAKQRKKLTQLETAAFGGSAGAGAIARDRAGVL